MLAFETLGHPRRRKLPELAAEKAQTNYIKAIGKGMLKVMSKMGISTYQSYCGAQIFDAVGLSTEFVDDYFTGTRPDRGRRPGGVAEEAARRHRARPMATPAYATRSTSAASMPVPPARRGPCLDPRDASPICSTRCAATLPDNYEAFATRSTSRPSGC